MENCVCNGLHRTILTLPSPLSSSSSASVFSSSSVRFFANTAATRPLVGVVLGGGGGGGVGGPLGLRRRRLVVRAGAGATPCEFSSLNSPLEPRSTVGKFLSGVLQNHRQLFHVAVGEELKLLADDRDAALARMVLGSGSDEALLHRDLAGANK
ncbi:hypothetical protein PIB30_117268 [Stylosanthes scabra]|uniref:Uncharacterized protein n=1 Tax=Stylosanthes scabra TaxID=79078 RepID=A0ABU6ZCL6_9FABA|nr:hypothetical protein [Stylosanthes scabra]